MLLAKMKAPRQATAQGLRLWPGGLLPLALVGCNLAAPLAPQAAGKPDLAGREAVGAPRLGQDQVTTPPAFTAELRHILADEDGRVVAVQSHALRRWEGQGEATALQTTPGQGLYAFAPLASGTARRDGTLFGVTSLGRLFEQSPTGELREHPLPKPLDQVLGLAFDSQGTLYLGVDEGLGGPGPSGRCRIGKIPPGGAFSWVAGGAAGYADGVGEAARFNGINALACDAFDNLYVADARNQAIRRVGQDGQVSTVAGPDPTQPWPSPAPGQPPHVLPPETPGAVAVRALSVSQAGELFYASADNRIHRVGPEGEDTVLAGTGRRCEAPRACSGGFGVWAEACPSPPPPDACLKDGPVAQAEFNGIQAMVCLNDGRLAVLDGAFRSGGKLLRLVDWPGAQGRWAAPRPGPLKVLR